jgi:UDP-N-acetylenolpyruvoylglucosamine reductase
MPMYQQTDGRVKIPLAWVLDHVLGLKGYEKDGARLYEKQPLILVATTGADASAVETLADDVAKKVFDATGIIVEREVESFGKK